MKYKAKDYAKALVELLLLKATSVDEKKLLALFLKLLEKNGDTGKAKEIIILAEALFFKKTGRKKIILETARKMDLKQRDSLASLIKEGDIFQEKINKDLIAGVKIIVDNERQLDVSMLKKIQQIF